MSGYMQSTAIFQLHELVPLIGEGNTYQHRQEDLDIVTVRVGSLRMRTFAEKGCDCVVCGIKGVIFSLERCTRKLKDVPERVPCGKWHFNLYGRGPEGQLVLMTHDHIWPLSQGGYNIMENSVTMCTRCNNKKGDKLPSPEFLEVHGCAYDPNKFHASHPPGLAVHIRKAKPKIRTPEEITEKAARRLAWQNNPVYNGRTKQEVVPA